MLDKIVVLRFENILWVINMYCKNCGNKISGENKYCNRCGMYVTNSTLDNTGRIISLEELEFLRKKVVKKEITGLVIGILIILLVLIIFGASALQGIFALIVLIWIFIFLFTRKDKNNFQRAYKRTIVLESLRSIFSDVYYEPNNGIREEVLRSTSMINMGDRYYSNDYISAKYKNIPFVASDVHIEEEYEDSDGDTHTVTLFKGQWFIFDFNKSFKADLQICEKGFRNNKRGSLFSEDRLKKVELEDINFNKQFNVYAVNELDAFYILTPNTMEKIKEVENKVSGSLLFCFIDNKLHVGLYNSKDLFEYKNMYKSINLEQEKNNVLQDMKNITEFVDVLDLDNDLFRREI